MVITFAGFRRFIVGGIVGSVLGALIVILLRALLGLEPAADPLSIIIGILIGGGVGSMYTTGGIDYLFRDHPPFNVDKPGFWRGVLAGIGGAIILPLVVMAIRGWQGLDAGGEPLLLIIVALMGLVGGIAWGGGFLNIDMSNLPLGPKPGLGRAIPLAILAFMLSGVIVFVIRALQQMDPLYDARVNLVLAPFLVSAAFIYGMGGFDPRMSQHAHPPEGEDEDSKSAIIEPGQAIKEDSADSGHAAHGHDDHRPPTPFSLLTGSLWTVTTLTLLLLGVFFVFALLPTGLRLDTTADPAASTSEFATNMEFLTPLGLKINDTNMIQADKLTVFAGFIIFTMLSLLLFGGAIAFLFHFLNQGVTTVHAQTTTSIDDPENTNNWVLFLLHVPVRLIRLSIEVAGAVSGSIAHGLRQGIPSFFQR